MSTVTKYPSQEFSLVTQRNSNGDLTEAAWTALEKIEANDQVFAQCSITAKDGLTSKPGQILASNFGFNLKKNARINSIKVEWAAHVRDGSNGTSKVPVIPGINISIVNDNIIIN